MKLLSKFPEFYKDLIPELLSWEVPEEKFANCSNCHLCASDKLSISQSKCCTYHAILPNYMVGAILEENVPEWEEGQKRVLNKINKKVGVTPFGITGGKEMTKLNQKFDRFPNPLTTPLEVRKAFICPYLDNGNCTIWKYRSELCITYFCHPVSGKTGSKFWSELYSFIRFMERLLSLYALRRIGISDARLHFEILNHDSFDFSNTDGSIDVEKYYELWRPFGEQKVHFKKCTEVVLSLTPQEVKNLLGKEGEWRLNKCQILLNEAKKNVLPDRLKFSEDNVITQLEKDQFRITSRKGEFVDVDLLNLMGLKMMDGLQNVTDVLRKTKLVAKIDSRELNTLIDKSILTIIDGRRF